MDQYSGCLVRNADEAIQAIELGDRKTALVFLRHLRGMLANGLPNIIALAMKNRTDLATASLMNADFVLNEAEIDGDTATAALARQWIRNEERFVLDLVERASQ